MRLAEEKLLMLLETIALLFILMASIGYDISIEKINERQANIYLLENKANNMMINLLDMTQQRNFYMIMDSLAINLNVSLNNVYTVNESKGMSSIPAKLRENLNSHKITTKEYFEGMERHFEAGLERSNIEMDHQDTQIEQLFLDKMVFWNWIKNICNWIRIGAILISAFLYLCIYREINKRKVNKI